jgi:hypothetical protein
MERADFLKRLAVLADLCSKDLSPDLIRLYDHLLAKDYSYDQLCVAIEQIILDRKDRDPFPSPRTVLDKLRPPVDDDALAIEAASRVIGAISKFGYCNPSEACEYIGELGWAIVDREGGWVALCEKVESRQLPALRAQWRDLAKSILLRARDADNTPPGLPAGTPKPSLPTGVQRIGAGIARSLPPGDL